MIKALLSNDVAILGISRENINRLLENQPIKVNLASLGLPSQVVIIVAGETEEDILEDLRSIGAERTDA